MPLHQNLLVVAVGLLHVHGYLWLMALPACCSGDKSSSAAACAWLVSQVHSVLMVNDITIHIPLLEPDLASIEDAR